MIEGLVVGAVAAPLLLLGTAAATRRLDTRLLVAGLRNGFVVALALATGLVLLVTSCSVGRPFLFTESLSLGGALLLGLLGAAVLVVPYLWSGTVLVLLGQLFRAGPGWSRRGAWAVAPIVLAGGLAGYQGWRTVEEMAQRPAQAVGTVQLEVAGVEPQVLTVSGQALCGFHPDGGLFLTTEEGDQPPLATAHSERVDIFLSVQGGQPDFGLRIGERDAMRTGGEARLDLEAGWSPPQGRLSFSDLRPLDEDLLEPDPLEAWSGSLTWSC